MYVWIVLTTRAHNLTSLIASSGKESYNVLEGDNFNLPPHWDSEF